MKKLGFTFSALLFVTLNSLATATLVSGTNVVAGSTGGAPVTTSAVNSTGGTLTTCSIGWYDAVEASACTDSKSNSYTGLTKRVESNIANRLFYGQNPAVGSGHTFTGSSPTNQAYPSVCAAVFSGMKTSSVFIAQNGNFGFLISTLQTGSLSTASGNLVIATVGWGNEAGSASIDSGFTILAQIGGLAGNHQGCAIAWKVGTGSAENPTWTLPSTTVAAATINTFDAASGAVPAPSMLTIGVGR